MNGPQPPPRHQHPSWHSGYPSGWPHHGAWQPPPPQGPKRLDSSAWVAPLLGTIMAGSLGLLALFFIGLYWLKAHGCPQDGCMAKPMEQFHSLRNMLGVCALLSFAPLVVSWALPWKVKYRAARIVVSQLIWLPMLVPLYNAMG
ncbi:hypothetical protein [Streptomyces sp. XD-27]|uniref:hypothetical protein n=1 Tax=Streptomyces sp. XD-27 TaxID=3062779 RepID=UPI0026F41AAE|nr:hypothetical protein [Streptomyces sp. XD-27]WKX71032.1 hypothetical protein Q3Y56_14940 [Streptomyces sp. XD-27]